MRDLIGYLALIVSLAGQLQLARSGKYGWQIRSLAGLGWIAFAWVSKSGPLLLTSHLYFFIDIYGWLKRKEK